MESPKFHVQIIAGLLLSISLGMIPADVNANARANFVLKVVKFSRAHVLNKPTFDICVLGDNAVFNALKAKGGRTLHKRKLKVHKLSSAGQAPGKKCNVLYMGAGSASAALYRKVLTISSGGDFAKRGGMVQYHAGGKSNLSVNIKSLRRAGLQLDLSLIKLARTVYRK
ncbi:MAG: YfiR family protein [Pseudomonadota bacterium]